MWRASLLLVSTLAFADRASITQQLAAENAAIDSALASVADKLAITDDERTRRLAAAYRVLHAPPLREPARRPDRDALATARRRAAARMLVARDFDERRLLAEELAHLRDAKTRNTADTARVAEIELPATLERPAKGVIARKFGTFVHERSKATLSRRGVDIEVEAQAAVVATADGIVRYAGPIRGLDRGVVIDHGSFFTVIAKLGELAVPMGVPVKRGDRVGRAARHRAYVEVRVKIGPSGLPIDPEPLFAR